MEFHGSMQKIEKLAAVLHSVDNQQSNRHVYYAEDRFELTNSLFLFGCILIFTIFYFDN